jgi:DNA (cytosine-5)-methyltransferase 1
VVAAVDSDELAATTYALNHPATKLIQADIRKVDPQELMRFLGLSQGELDLLAGCPPCQGFSRIRTLNGAREGDDQQNNLIWHS